MTNEELLKEAKRRYSVGTKFKCKHASCLCEVTMDGTWDTVNIDNKPSVIFYPKESFGKYVYLEWLSTEWAEIVELPKQEEKSLVGRYLKALVDNPQQIHSLKKGEYAKIKTSDDDGGIFEPIRNINNLEYSKDLIGKIWELMPIGWTPEQENTPQFEKNKWYVERQYNFYAKCLKFENDQMFCNEHILTKSYYTVQNYSFSSGYDWKLLTDLNEIQPYLPDEHPDKIVKQESNMFKRGDYIVTLELRNNITTDCAKKNYCFKQRETKTYITPELDVTGHTRNSNSTLSFDKSNNLLNWRYATPEEIAEYDRLGKPYDVTTLQKKEEPKYEYEVVHCKTQEEWDFVCNIIRKPAIRYFPAHNTIRFSGEGWNNKEYYQQQSDVKIYSFQEWCNKFGHKPDFMNKQEEYKVGDWVLLSSDAGGWGASPDKINNKILQITAIDLNDNPTSDSKGRYYFGDIRTIGKKIVRKALPHKIPQETNNSIPEYVECITDKFGSIHKNVIYKLTSNSNKEWYWLEGINMGSYSSNFFKPSTEEAYKNQFKQPIITKENTSNNDNIEVGDEVEVINDDIVYNHSQYKKGDRFIVISKQKSILKQVNYWINDISIHNCKLIKKASQTTTTYEKQVAEQPKNVPITTDIRIPKSISVTLTNTEKEVKLTIKKPKTIKI